MIDITCDCDYVLLVSRVIHIACYCDCV